MTWVEHQAADHRCRQTITDRRPASVYSRWSWSVPENQLANATPQAYYLAMHLTFQAYMTAMSKGDPGYSEFVSDAQRDTNFPKVASWPELKLYLKGRGATRRFMRQALRAWRRYAEARFLAACGVVTDQATGPNGMRTVVECLAKAAEMNMRAEDCDVAETRAEFFELGIRWRDLARRALRQDKWSEMRGRAPTGSPTVRADHKGS
jgi:hypothetical protein